VVEFRDCPMDEEPAAALAQGMRDEIAVMYDGLVLDGPDMPKAGPDELSPPGGTFIVGYQVGGSEKNRLRNLDGETPVCCGGLKRLPDGACEIKKMFVLESARGRGVARELLVELERRARELGYEVARLDTGPRQPRAQRMYERAGYAAIENFNANPVATFFGEKRL
jgi:GNAT superfamily N-acetyltransferase